MPKLLTMGSSSAVVVASPAAKPARDELREALEKVKPKALREQLLGLLAKV